MLESHSTGVDRQSCTGLIFCATRSKPPSFNSIGRRIFCSSTSEALLWLCGFGKAFDRVPREVVIVAVLR